VQNRQDDGLRDQVFRARSLPLGYIIAHVRSRRQSGAGPSTANNDIVWLRVNLRYARAAWDLPFDLTVIDNASEVLKTEKLISKAKRRSRRPTAVELDTLTELFERRDKRRSNIPMSDIMWFAIYSARRQAEITDLHFSDNNRKLLTGAVEDLKHPTEHGQIQRFKHTPFAWEIICRQIHDDNRIFPFEPRSIGSAFRQACKLPNIHDLHFHNLRHEATSRLFAAGINHQTFKNADSASDNGYLQHTELRIRTPTRTQTHRPLYPRQRSQRPLPARA
jgi:integrase